jgi:acyl carrier protein
MTEKIIELTAAHLGLEQDTISETSSFKEDLGVDSLDLFELVMELEEEFGIEIPSEDLENLNTIGDVAKYIESRQ